MAYNNISHNASGAASDRLVKPDHDPAYEAKGVRISYAFVEALKGNTSGIVALTQPPSDDVVYARVRFPIVDLDNSLLCAALVVGINPRIRTLGKVGGRIGATSQETLAVWLPFRVDTWSSASVLAEDVHTYPLYGRPLTLQEYPNPVLGRMLDHLRAALMMNPCPYNGAYEEHPRRQTFVKHDGHLIEPSVAIEQYRPSLDLSNMIEALSVYHPECPLLPAVERFNWAVQTPGSTLQPSVSPQVV